MRKQNPLEKIDGVKIRCHYFDDFCVFVLCWVVAWILSYPISELFGNPTKFSWTLDAIRLTMTPCIVLTLCLLIATYINRFFFGRVVCVLGDEGIHYNGRVIPYADILEMEHFERAKLRITFGGGRHVPTSSSGPYPICRMTLYCKSEVVEIIDAPFSLYLEAKKRNPAIRLRWKRIILNVTIQLSLLMAIALGRQFWNS